MPKEITDKEAVTLAAQIAQTALAYSKQGYENITVKQVNDPNDEGVLQEQILLDMTDKNGEAVELRLFSKREGSKLTIKEKQGKVNAKRS